jgi:molybdopterin synthase sulfur carrier subunit
MGRKEGMPKVRYYASLRQVAGRREDDFEAGTVKEMLDAVSKAYQGKLDRYLKISTVLVNGKNVIHIKGRKTRLRPDDVVSIFPPMGGG